MTGPAAGEGFAAAEPSPPGRLEWVRAADETDPAAPCIEFAHAPGGLVHIRQSDAPDDVVTTTRAKWDAFVLGVRNDEFDHFVDGPATDGTGTDRGGPGLTDPGGEGGETGEPKRGTARGWGAAARSPEAPGPVNGLPGSTADVGGGPYAPIMPATFEHERYCAEIIEQTRLLRDVVKSTPLDTPVPSCPGWSLRDLAVHVGNGHRWAAEIVAARASGPLPVDDVPGHGGPVEAQDAVADAASLDRWLAESAQRVSDELRISGPDAAVWTFVPTGRSGFWARRRALETLVHRLDAALAADTEFTADPALAADSIDEWLDILTTKEAAEHRPALRTLSERAGESLHLHATDADEGVEAEWLVALEADGVTWRRSHEKATVAVRGPLNDVLGVFFRRLPPDSERVEVLGDAGLFDFWLECVSFE